MIELELRGKNILSKIYIESGILRRASEFCLGAGAVPPVGNTPFMRSQPSKICVITDSNVAPLYLGVLEESLGNCSIPFFHYVIDAGEEHKTLETVSGIYDFLSHNGFDRKDMIIALGGGVTGDIAGFAAATYLRGIKYLIQIPTTLLAQVDSSVGGKCGVDLPHGKNLVGAIRQPDLVLIDPDVLQTLPEHVFAAGMAEVIKYGCIDNPKILDMVSRKHGRSNLELLIAVCVGIKIEVVEQDETEEGLRRILNFGHTIGHGAEKLGNFTDLSHGEAVAIGMAAAVKMGETIGITKKGCYEKLVDLLKSFGLPTELNYPVQDIYEAMLSDKKKEGNSIHFIYIEDFGKVKMRKTQVEELKKIMKVLGE